MRGHTRCLTLRREDDHLVATSALQCGFVSMRGHGRDPVRRFLLRGDDAVLILDDPITQVDSDALQAALDGPRFEAWSPVSATVDDSAAFETVHLWLAIQPRPYGILAVDREKTAGLLDPQDRFFCPTLLTEDSFTYLTLRRQGDQIYQFGAHGLGLAATNLVADLLDLLTVWNAHHRAGPGPCITVHPSGSPVPEAAGLRLLVPRRHSLIAVTWPGSSR